MYPDVFLQPAKNAKGFGLITALFVIVILATFGLLLARYSSTSSVASAEDYLWAQAIYSAETTAQRAILFNDNGGGAAYPGEPRVAGFTTTLAPAFAALPAPGNPVTINVGASKALAGTDTIAREIEVKYVL